MDPAQHQVLAQVLTEKEAGARLGLSTSYLRKLRYNGGGPTYIKLAERRIGYREGDLDLWLNSRRVPGKEVACG
jgi:predicted DNA-binding transcriptional regulator AlpA